MIVASARVARSWMLAPVLVAGLLGGSAFASENRFNLILSDDHEIELRRFGAGGRTLLLWLPSERGLNEAHAEHARALAQLGHEVWLADLHSAYFVQRDRRSISRFPLDDVVALIDAATRASDAKVVLVSSSRGAQLALIAAREWQLRYPGASRIQGAVLMHANLYRERPEIGEAARYLPIARATNLPVYLLDAQYSSRSAYIGTLGEVLGAGGSAVYTQVVQDVQGGFFAREDSDLAPGERVAKHGFARLLDRAVRALENSPTPSMAAPSPVSTVQFSARPRSASALRPLDQALPAPRLRLPDYERREYSLEDRAARVVLVNFWATWCKPCVDEIPSLHRLRETIGDSAFEIVTVNVAENHDRVGRFLERVPIELPLLMDLDGRAARDWNIYVYPSSFLVDREGIIRYAYLGALEWDLTENITIIRSLLRKN